MSKNPPFPPIKGIGIKTRQWLHEIGIDTHEQLALLGSVEVYRRLKIARPQEVTLNALWGLEASLLDIHWRDLPPEIKAQLLAELQD